VESGGHQSSRAEFGQMAANQANSTDRAAHCQSRIGLAYSDTSIEQKHQCWLPAVLVGMAVRLGKGGQDAGDCGRTWH